MMIPVLFLLMPLATATTEGADDLDAAVIVNEDVGMDEDLAVTGEELIAEHQQVDTPCVYYAAVAISVLKCGIRGDVYQYNSTTPAFCPAYYVSYHPLNWGQVEDDFDDLFNWFYCERDEGDPSIQ